MASSITDTAVVSATTPARPRLVSGTPVAGPRAMPAQPGVEGAVVVIAKQFVQLGAGLHLFQQLLLRAVGNEHGQTALSGPHGQA